MATVSFSPWMGTVTLTTANTAYCLGDLLAASSNPPLMQTSKRAQFVAIQADPNGGSAKFWIGNQFMTSSDHGVEIYATQVWPIYSMDSNLIQLSQIYLMSDTNSMVMNITFITR